MLCLFRFCNSWSIFSHHLKESDPDENVLSMDHPWLVGHMIEKNTKIWCVYQIFLYFVSIFFMRVYIAEYKLDSRNTSTKLVFKREIVDFLFWFSKLKI
jgi:hypothetical protein